MVKLKLILVLSLLPPTLLVQFTPRLPSSPLQVAQFAPNTPLLLPRLVQMDTQLPKLASSWLVPTLLVQLTPPPQSLVLLNNAQFVLTTQPQLLLPRLKELL